MLHSTSLLFTSLGHAELRLGCNYAALRFAFQCYAFASTDSAVLCFTSLCVALLCLARIGGYYAMLRLTYQHFVSLCFTAHCLARFGCYFAKLRSALLRCTILHLAFVGFALLRLAVLRFSLLRLASLLLCFAIQHKAGLRLTTLYSGKPR